MISPVPGQARLQAARSLRTFRAKCTLASTWTLSTATSGTLKSAAPAPANDTASALEPIDSSSSELIPASVPIGLGSKRISPVSGRVILKARSRSAQRHVSNSGTISTPTSDKSKSVGPASACTEAGASAPRRTSDQSAAPAPKRRASRSICPVSDHVEPKPKRSLGASVTQDSLTITCASVSGRTSGQTSTLTPSRLAFRIVCPASDCMIVKAQRSLGASMTQCSLTNPGKKLKTNSGVQQMVSLQYRWGLSVWLRCPVAQHCSRLFDTSGSDATGPFHQS
ncbi:hypothetical protein GJAV_G00056320, partial [Gymnothorax javanicus]